MLVYEDRKNNVKNIITVEMSERCAKRNTKIGLRTLANVIK